MPLQPPWCDMIAPCCGVHHLQAIPAGLTSDSTCSHNSPQSGIQDHTTLRPALHPSCRQQRPPPACHHVRATHRGATSSHDRMLSTTSSHDSILPTITIPVYNNGIPWLEFHTTSNRRIPDPAIDLPPNLRPGDTSARLLGQKAISLPVGDPTQRNCKN
jgi:hypothetical protein